MNEKIWAPNALAHIERDIEKHLNLFMRPGIDMEDWKKRIKRLNAEVDRLRQGGIAKRPGRRMPTLAKIAAINNLGDEPHCFKCGYSEGDTWESASRYLDRAHVIDRAADGLDIEVNFRPLCRLCHRIQPMFVPGDEDQALTWFARPLVEELVEIIGPVDKWWAAS